MFTIFDLFQLLFPLIGLVYGFTTGQRYFGLLGGVGGALLGLAVGFVAGRLPFLIAWRSANFGGKSTDQLRQFFQNDQYFVFHLALAELLSRGEDVSSEKERIIDLLASDSLDRRRFGWASLQIAFPTLAEEILGFDPQSPSSLHVEQILRMKEERN